MLWLLLLERVVLASQPVLVSLVISPRMLHLFCIKVNSLDNYCQSYIIIVIPSNPVKT